MKSLQLNKSPFALAEMLIRKPAATVFEAFINPEITTNFWFTKSSGPLEEGKEIIWEWEMYGLKAAFKVIKITENKSIMGQWPYGQSMTELEFTFTPVKDGTFVSIKNSGFQGDVDKVVSDALESKGGFTWVLAGLKSYLEYGINLNLILDAYPKDIRRH